MINNQIKQSYASDIAEFVKNGGTIKQAVNTTKKAAFNTFNADAAAKNAAKPNSQKNQTLRERAAKSGLKSYKTVAPCNSCGTSERSVRSNACLECDRRRVRARVGLSAKNLQGIGHYLLDRNEAVEFTSGGKKYVLKVEVANEKH